MFARIAPHPSRPVLPGRTPKSENHAFCLYQPRQLLCYEFLPPLTQEGTAPALTPNCHREGVWWFFFQNQGPGSALGSPHL